MTKSNCCGILQSKVIEKDDDYYNDDNNGDEDDDRRGTSSRNTKFLYTSVTS